MKHVKDIDRDYFPSAGSLWDLLGIVALIVGVVVWLVG